MKMNTKKSLMLFSGIGAVSVSIALLLSSLNGNSYLFANADNESNEISFTNEMLQNVLLNQDYTGIDNQSHYSNQNDKKFTIELDGGKFIYGALLFNDCSYQYVGNTLGDAFGLDAKSDNSNFDFALILDVKGINSASLSYTLTNTYSGLKNYRKLALMKDYEEGNLNLYEDIEDANYRDVIGENDLSTELTYYDNRSDDEFIDIDGESSINDTIMFSSFLGVTRDIICFKITGYSLPNNNQISITITDLTLRYNCRK